MSVVDRFYALIVRYPWAAIAVTLALAGGLVSFADLEIDTRLEIWFLEDDPAVSTYNDYVARFDSDEFAAVAVVADDVFTPVILAAVQELGERAEALDPVLRVHSLATAEQVISDGTELSVRPLFDDVPQTAEALEALRAAVHADRLLNGTTAQGDTTTIVIIEHTPFEDLRDKADFAIDVRQIANEVLGDIPFHAAGNAFVEEALQSYTMRDIKLLAPLTIIAILMITLLLFRDFWSTIVPTVIVGLTLFSTIGLAGLLQVKLNIITTIILPLSVAVGVADSVHLLSGFRERVGLGLNREDAMRSAWRELLFPCVITTATTAAGLGSLLAANLRPLRQFGWMGAVTVCFALFYTLVLVPAIFLKVKPPTPRPVENGRMGRVLATIADTAWKHHKLVLVATVLLGVFSAIGTTRIHVGADFTAYFKDDDPLAIDSNFIDSNLGGTGSVDLLIEADDVREPDILRRMEAFETMIRANPAVLSTDSPSELVKNLHERYFNDPERYRIPDSLPASAQLLSQTEGSQMHNGLFELDYSAARVRARIRSSDYSALVEAMDQIEDDTADIFGDAARAEITGVGKLVANLDRYIVTSQLRSFIIAFITVGLLLGLFFRSTHFGIWALVPNGLPILLVLGVMGWLNIMLDVGTVMVASIMLGLIVDDTVHFLARYRAEVRRLSPEERDDPEALRLAARRTGIGTGAAIATTSLILVCGFWVSLFASFQPNINFGLMCGASALIALICDLIALPAVIRIFPLPNRG